MHGDESSAKKTKIERAMDVGMEGYLGMGEREKRGMVGKGMVTKDRGLWEKRKVGMGRG